MKRLLLIVFGALLLVAGCQKKAEPVKTMFSGNVGPARPEQKSIRIRPGNPGAGDVLTVKVPGNISAKSITWYIDNQQAAVTPTLHSGFKKGDSITAVVTAGTAGNKQRELTSPAVVIQDTPPVIGSISLQPLYPTVASIMQVTVRASDADGDPVSLSYAWYVNNVSVADQTGDLFSCSSYKHGDVIHVVVTPSDGEQNGSPVTSSFISLQDTPPVIISQPPVAVTGTTYTYKVEARDIDNDPLTYTLKSAPSGMTIDNDGTITWELPAAAQAVQTNVKIVVKDGHGGEATQSFPVTFGRKKL